MSIVPELSDPEIVIVDGDLEIVEAIRHRLAQLGVKVIGAENTESMMVVAHHSAANSFILDMNMGPGRTQEGLENLRVLKSFKPDANVALYSAFHFSGHQMIDAVRLGADIVIQKGADGLE